jgi:uncharacterized membrane protein YqiK
MTTTASDWDALEKRLDNVKKPVRTFKLCDDPDIRDRYLKATREAEDADSYLKKSKDQAKDQAYDPEALALVEKETARAKAELAAAKKAYDAHTIVLRFTALEQQQLEELQNEHPASEEDEERGNDFAFDSFAPALISAASLDGMPVEAAARYLKTWTSADARDLWNAAWSIQHAKRTDLGKG